MITKIYNATFITDRLQRNKNLYIKDDKIIAFTEDEFPFEHSIDANGLYVSPGFIDIHTHGGGGYDFTDGSVEAVLKAAKTHALHGTTTIFPTAASMSFEDTITFIENTKSAVKMNAPGNAFIVGAHLEGPYFSQTQRGAQNPTYIKSPCKEEYTKLIKTGEGVIKRISYAPELDGSSELCQHLNNLGIISAFGHTNAIYEELKPLIDNGCKLATHLYSGMNTITRSNLQRKLGAVETAYLEDDVIVEVIADGIHLPIELLKLIYRIKGADKICLVTDSMRGAAQENGPSVLGPLHDGVECIIKDGVAYLPDMSAYAGSIATADRLIRVMYHKVGVPLCEVIKMMCETPAKAMKLNNRGKIAPGFYADFVFFNQEIEIKKVIISGKELQ